MTKLKGWCLIIVSSRPFSQFQLIGWKLNMQFRSSSLNNLHPYRRRQESICLSGEDSPLDLSMNTREINLFRLSKLKLHRSSSQYSHYRSSSPTTPEPLSLHNSPRILSRESSAESLFENGVIGVSLSCPVTPTKVPSWVLYTRI